MSCMTIEDVVLDNKHPHKHGLEFPKDSAEIPGKSQTFQQTTSEE